MDDIHSERGFLYILGDRTDNMGNNYYKGALKTNCI